MIENNACGQLNIPQIPMTTQKNKRINFKV